MQHVYFIEKSNGKKNLLSLFLESFFVPDEKR